MKDPNLRLPLLDEFGCFDKDVCKRGIEAVLVVVALHERLDRAEDRQPQRAREQFVFVDVARITVWACGPARSTRKNADIQTTDKHGCNHREALLEL